MTTDQVFELYERHLNPSLVALVKFMGFDAPETEAQGCVVRTTDGREYLDCLGGFGVLCLGHRHPRVIAAVQAQLARMPLSSRVLFNEQTARLAQLLAEVTPGALQYTFFCNSGSEAVEGALKLARLATGRTRIIATENGFHGKTLGALSATGREVFRAPFQPLVPGFSHVPFGDADALAAALDDGVAAFIVEPIQAEGGVQIPPDDYLPAVRNLCDRHGALLILDEVQTGFGRTGSMFACEPAGVAPDLLVLAKALGGGVMPIGAVVGTPAVWKSLEPNPLLHSSTFGGNPLACAAGIAAIETTRDEGLCVRASAMGAKLMTQLQAVQHEFPDAITEVRGRGLLIGVEFANDDLAGLTIAGLAQRHVLAAYTLNQPKVIRIEPPLIITEAQMEQAVTALREAVAQTVELVADLEE